MYELTNETVAGRKYYAKLELDDGTTLTNYGDEAVGITSISISSTLCGSESVSIGCVNAASVTIVLEAGTALENQRFTLYLGQEFDGAVEWVPMGIFTGIKAEVNEDSLTVEAWDGLYFAGGDYTPSDSVTGECAVATALYDVCDQLGIQFLQSSVPEDVTIAGMPTGLTCSAAIGHLAALCGANACMDRDGYLVFRQFEETGQVLGTDDCYSGGMVFKTSDFTVASLTNTLETETTDDDGETTTETTEVERTTGASGGSIALTNPLMTEDNIDTAWDVVKGFAYRPATLTAVGQLAVDVGDILRVPTLTGGRNYLPNTRSMDGWTMDSNVTMAEDDEGYMVATWAAAETLAYNSIYSRDPIQFSLVRGQTVMVSFDIRSDDYETINTSTTNRIMVIFTLCKASSTSRTLYKNISLTGTSITDDWMRLTYTTTLSDDFFTDGSGDINDTTRFYLRICNYSLYSMQVRKVKLEIGDAATSWTPAFEDDDESIYLVPVMAHTLDYDGGLKSILTAAGESESQQSAAVSGPVAQQLKELTAQVTDTKVLASGKNAVYYAAAAPSADDYTLSVNDLWFDTSGGDYAMYYWGGEQWVAAPFGTSALGDGVVTAAKIVAGAVTAEKLNVSELSAIAADLGTITGGSININDLFIVDSDGNLTAVSGIIGGLTIARTYLLMENTQEEYTGDASGALIDEGSAIVSAFGENEEDEVEEGTYNIINSNNSSSESAFLAVNVPISENTYFLYKAAAYILHDGRAKFASVAANTAYLGDTTVDGALNVTGSGAVGGTLDVTGDTTVNGFPVPEIQQGYVSITPSEANKPTGTEITFDREFSGTPRVYTQARTSVPGTGVLGTGVSDVTSTGATIYVTRTSTTTTGVNWLAVYLPE
ncbi:MAG: hypothetical protein LUD84_01805 [Clostridiales bacterium]|nr:hypothetical protein [Clostridiales bacterium]